MQKVWTQMRLLPMEVSEEVPILDLLHKQIYAADDISRQDFAIFSCGEKVKEKI